MGQIGKWVGALALVTASMMSEPSRLSADSFAVSLPVAEPTAREHAQRAARARARAQAAIELEGARPGEQTEVRALAEQAIRAAGQVAGAGASLQQSRLRLSEAERLAEQAMARAEAAANERVARERDLESHRPEIEQVERMSAHDLGKACKGGNQVACVRASALEVLRSPTRKNLASAQALATKACQAEVSYGCSMAEILGRDARDLAEASDNDWYMVHSMITRLTVLRYKARLARELMPEMSTVGRAQATMALQRMEEDYPRRVRDDLCPYKRDFIARFGQQEFTLRAKAMCQDAPPETSGRDENVTLPADCALVAALKCDGSTNVVAWTARELGKVSAPKASPGRAAPAGCVPCFYNGDCDILQEGPGECCQPIGADDPAEAARCAASP